MRYTFPIRRATPIVAGWRAYKRPRWKWLEKLLRKCRLLIDDYDPITMDRYETIDIASDDVLQVCREGMNDLMRLGCDRPTRLYIGQEYFEHLMTADAVMRMNGPIVWPVRIFGCEVVVTPYLEQGFLPVWENDG